MRTTVQWSIQCCPSGVCSNFSNYWTLHGLLSPLVWNYFFLVIKKKSKPVSEHDHSIKPKTDPFKTLKHLVLTWLMQELFLSLSFTLSVVCERARESERIYSHINFYLMAANSGGSLQRIISFHFKFPVHGHVCRLIKIFLPPWCRWMTSTRLLPRC